MSDFSNYLKPCGILAALGFVTTLISSLLVAFSVAERKCAIIMGIILFLFTLFFIFKGIRSSEDKKYRSLCFVISLIDLVAGILLEALPLDWHVTSGYVNRFAIYVIVVAAIQSSIITFWTFVTSVALSDFLESNNLLKNDETYLYFACNLLTEAILCYIISIGRQSTPDTRTVKIIEYSIGIWFFGALISRLVAFLIGKKQGSGLIPVANYDEIEEVNRYLISMFIRVFSKLTPRKPMQFFLIEILHLEFSSFLSE
jgi:hypothetical protein